MIDHATSERSALIAGTPRETLVQMIATNQERYKAICRMDLICKLELAKRALGTTYLLHPSRAREIRPGSHLPGRVE